MGKDRSKVYRVSFELFDPRNETVLAQILRQIVKREKDNHLG